MKSSKNFPKDNQKSATKGDSSRVPSSIKLIDIQKNKLCLTSEGLDHLKKIKYPFGVLVCLGPYRTGKSYLLNRIVQQKDAFGVGHRDVTETKGIWMYEEMIQIKQEDGNSVKFLVLDAEVRIQIF